VVTEVRGTVRRTTGEFVWRGAGREQCGGVRGERGEVIGEKWCRGVKGGRRRRRRRRRRRAASHSS
jgi:hypothetical protein